MITYHILKLLEDEGFGTIDALVDGLYWEVLPLNGQGVAIYSRGSAIGRGLREIQAFDLYSRGSSNLKGADKLEKIKEYIDNNYVQCTLPTAPKSIKQYEKVTLEITGNIENLGLDENGRLLFRLSGEAIYNKETN